MHDQLGDALWMLLKLIKSMMPLGADELALVSVLPLLMVSLRVDSGTDYPAYPSHISFHADSEIGVSAPGKKSSLVVTFQQLAL